LGFGVHQAWGELLEGLESGVSDKSVEEIFREVKNRMRADGRL